MFWIICGLILIAALIFAIMKLCMMSKAADSYATNLYQTTHRGDDDGNNQSL